MIPSAAVDQAHENMTKDALRRYLCTKYTMPPTDPRFKAYTPEEAMLEWLEDAIESGSFIPGVGGKPARKIMYKGEEIYATGSPVFDALERSWVDGYDPTQIESPPVLDDMRPIGGDILDEIRKRSAIEGID